MSEGMPASGTGPSEWLARAQTGDAESYGKFLKWAKDFVKSNASKHFRAWGMVKPEAIDDLTQDILLAIHQKRHTYVPGKPVEAWLYAIVRYKAIDGLRAKVRDKRNVSERDMPEGWEPVDPATSGSNAPSAVSLDAEAVLAVLSPRQREVLVMAKIEGASMEEISRRTGSSPGAIKVMVHRALRRLQQQFGNVEGGGSEKE